MLLAYATYYCRILILNGRNKGNSYFIKGNWHRFFYPGTHHAPYFDGAGSREPGGAETNQNQNQIKPNQSKKPFDWKNKKL